MLVDKGAGAADVILDTGGTVTVDAAVAPVKSLTVINSTLRVEPGADLDVVGDLDADAGGAVLAFGVDVGGASLVDIAGDARPHQRHD